MNRNKLFVVLFLFILALFLRLYRIEELTEFLGDQGVTALEIQHAYETRTIPLVGLLASTGFYQGPFYFYLLAPVFLLSSGNVVATAAFLGVLGGFTAVIIWYCGLLLFRNFWIAICVALLYTVSPTVIQQNRTIWNPTAIPFFTSLLLLCFIKTVTAKNYYWRIGVGTVLGILIQLHYSTYFFLPFTLLFWLYIFVRQTKQTQRRELFTSTALGGIGFIAVLSPFIFYQIKTGFADMFNFLAFIIDGPTTSSSFSFIKHILEPLSWLLSLYIPIHGIALTTAIAGVLIVLSYAGKRTFWHVFFTVWLAGGLIATGLTKGDIHLHYIAFLFLPLLFLIGFALQNIQKFINYKFFIFLLIVVSIIQIRTTDIFAKGNQDIPRIRAVVSYMKQDRMNEPFSFALLSSRSYSDPHYQFFFKKENMRRESWNYPGSRLLYIVCEKEPCPEGNQLSEQSTITALCNEFHCPDGFPILTLADWQFDKQLKVHDAMVYTFRRKELSQTK